MATKSFANVMYNTAKKLAYFKLAYFVKYFWIYWTDFFDNIFPMSERVTLPRVNPFDNIDKKKFKERFHLSKNVMFRLIEEVRIK